MLARSSDRSLQIVLSSRMRKIKEWRTSYLSFERGKGKIYLFNLRSTSVAPVLIEKRFTPISYKPPWCNGNCFGLSNKKSEVRNSIRALLIFIRKGIRILKCCASPAKSLFRKRLFGDRNALNQHFKAEKTVENERKIDFFPLIVRSKMHCASSTGNSEAGLNTSYSLRNCKSFPLG